MLKVVSIVQLGWIDFSKTERSKILSVLDLLQENGTLDELGIAPVRDGFSNIFFPGTSTIQTRAKYFLIVPYALKDLERSNETNPNVLRKTLDAIERSCGEQLLANNKDERGIVGGRSLQNHRWVKRTPSEIYWSGLRQYRIFSFGNWTLTEYLRSSAAYKKRKATLKDLRSKNDRSEKDDWDDKDAGNSGHIQFWNIPTYTPGWQKSLEMKLTPAEAGFLKQQIIATQPNSMLGVILQKNLTEVLDCDSFASLAEYMDLFPEAVQNDYQMALQFSHFLYIIRTVYNIIVSDSKNVVANQEYEQLQPYLFKEAQVDLDAIISRLGIGSNIALCKFLRTAQRLILEDDFDGLCKCIKDREVLLKGTSRAKTAHPGEFDPTAWFGGAYLDYRFYNAQTILRDIFEGEVNVDAES